MNFPRRVRPSKEMGNRIESARIETTTSRFDRPLLYRLSYAARREQAVGDYVNVEGKKRSINSLMHHLCP